MRSNRLKNLSIFPLLSGYFIPFDYLTIDDAISKDLIEVLEVQPNGSAPKRKIINKSHQMILIYGGEKLAKTKHQRNIGTNTLIPAKESVVIPATFIKKNLSGSGKFSANGKGSPGPEKADSQTENRVQTGI